MLFVALVFSDKLGGLTVAFGVAGAGVAFAPRDSKRRARTPRPAAPAHSPESAGARPCRVLRRDARRILRVARAAAPTAHVRTRGADRTDGTERDSRGRARQVADRSGDRLPAGPAGGIWPFVGGFWTLALARVGQLDLAWHELASRAQANRHGDWRFTAWFHGRTGTFPCANSTAIPGVVSPAWNGLR